MTTRVHQDDLEQLLRLDIEQEPAVFALFTEDGCRVADAVEPRLQALLSHEFPRMHFVTVSRSHAPALAAQLGLFVFPAIVVWFAGKETTRFVRHFSIDEVAQALARPYALYFDEVAPVMDGEVTSGS